MGSRMPAPSVLVSWCRVLHAAVLLSTTTRAVDHVARLLDFQSGTALRNMFRRYTGMRPGEVRGSEQLGAVLAVLRALISGNRDSAPTARPSAAAGAS